MDKKKVLEAVVKEVEAELAGLKSASKSAHEAATAEENQPENEFDTRALEAGYLAQAQAGRAVDLERALGQLENFPIPDFSAESPIRVGALIEIESEGHKHFHFLLPFGAGITVNVAGKKISVVTVTSPLGQALTGKKVGEEFQLKGGGHPREIEILKIW
jgi:transcription elongation GreA/GreB family factor